MPTRIQATGCIEVRGEGSVLGQRQGVAMWQRSHLWGGLAFNRLLEKLGKTGCPLSPFPSPSSITCDLGLLKAAIKTALHVKVSPGILKPSMFHSRKVLRRVLTAK